jgi:outer membrane protein TolC
LEKSEQGIAEMKIAALGLAALVAFAPRAHAADCTEQLRAELAAGRQNLLVAEHRYTTGIPDYQPVLDARRKLSSIEARLKLARCD